MTAENINLYLPDTLRTRAQSLCRVPFIKVGCPDALTFLEKSAEGLKNREKAVICFNGLPGAGKTWSRENLVEPFIRMTYPDIMISTLHWDLIEDKLSDKLLPEAHTARSEGRDLPPDFQELVRSSLKLRNITEKCPNFKECLQEETEKFLGIQIEHGKLYPPEMLLATSIYMEIELMRHLGSDGHEVILLDKPAGTGLRKNSLLRPDGTLFERNYATDIMQHLAQRSGIFENLGEKDIWTGYLGLVPGTTMEALMHIEFRDIFQHVQTSVTGGNIEQAMALRFSAAQLVRYLEQNSKEFALPEDIKRLIYLGDKLAIGKKQAIGKIDEFEKSVSTPLRGIIIEALETAKLAGFEEQLPGYLAQIGVNLATALIMLDECQNLCDAIGILYYEPLLNLGKLKETINHYQKRSSLSQAPADFDLGQ